MVGILLKAWNTFKDGSENIHSVNNAVKTIHTEHERIHAGMAWLNKDRYVVPPSTTAYYLFRVESYSNPSQIRNFGFVSNQGPMELHFREAPFTDVNSLGTPLSFNNMNRNSSNLPGMTLYGAPFVDVNSIGVHLDFILQPESAPGNQAAGGGASNVIEEWVIDNSKSYLFTLENTTVNSAVVESQFFVYRSGESLK